MNDNKTILTISQRIIAAGIYLAAFLFICRYFSGSWQYLSNTDSHFNILFISGALLLILGSYIVEPYFTKPVDVITNSIAILLALLSVKSPNQFFGYKFFFYASATICVLSIILIIFSSSARGKKIQIFFFEILTKTGQSKILFSVMYLLTIVSYFKNNPFEFVVFITFWVIVITKFFVENLVIWCSRFFLFLRKNRLEILGKAIGCENPFLYQVEVDFSKFKGKVPPKGELVYIVLENFGGVIGIIINQKHLLGKLWLSVYLLRDAEGKPLNISINSDKIFSQSKSIFFEVNAAYHIKAEDINESPNYQYLVFNPLYSRKSDFIGYVDEHSNINKISFHSLIDWQVAKRYLSEGIVIEIEIYKKDVLFQVIDGKTCEKKLDSRNVYGYITGIARKIGCYNKITSELEVVKWMPDIYTPVFFCNQHENSVSCNDCIGTLPETNLEINIKDYHALVTHNTAILGILGIGKSCLTFELISKVIKNTNVSVICIDITNEYEAELIKYGCSPQKLNNSDLIDSLETNYENINKDVHKGGNYGDFKRLLKDLLIVFFQTGKRTLIINPDDYLISKQLDQIKPKKVGPNQNDWKDMAPMTDLTVAEKTRLISEVILEICKEKGKSSDARCLIIYEEAHSLIPEWNSLANEGDKSAANGTAKVILQGRKYGLGSFVVTQRTANISKSILNQCNTIFAMRVFDDAGKQFLENYIGSDYSNVLPVLEERQAIAIGKALKLKQPVIIKLNDRDKIIADFSSSNVETDSTD